MSDDVVRRVKEDLERATAAFDDLAAREDPKAPVVHGCPPLDSGLTTCCRRTPFELPRFDRMTLDVIEVTCRRSV